MDYIVVFLFDFIIELSENTNINKHAIKLIESKQLPYKLIYSLKTVELEAFKTYIEIYLETRFIQSFKSFVNAFIFFNQKPDGNLRFYISY